MTQRLGPTHRNGIKRVQVGCGPHNLLPDWWNVDVRKFPGIDEVCDVTHPWPWGDLTYVFGEHFLEHLPLDQALQFLENAGTSLRRGGTLRLSTPNLEWVLLTHFLGGQVEPQRRILDTIKMNRAFHGWGHHFLYTKEVLTFVLTEMGFVNAAFYAYGESMNPDLCHLERHGGFQVYGGQPSVLIVEAQRDSRSITIPSTLTAFFQEHFLRYVASGH
jgi:predicted SAM-dependent methyltransferase